MDQEHLAQAIYAHESVNDPTMPAWDGLDRDAQKHYRDLAHWLTETFIMKLRAHAELPRMVTGDPDA